MLTNSLSDCKCLFDGPLINGTKIGMRCVVREAIKLGTKTKLAPSVACMEKLHFPSAVPDYFCFGVTDLVSNVYFSYAQPNTVKSQHRYL